SGCWIAARIAQAPPKEWPTRSAVGIPRWSSSAARSSASVAKLSGRSVSAVRPWPCISTATTRRVLASGRTHPASRRSWSARRREALLRVGRRVRAAAGRVVDPVGRAAAALVPLDRVARRAVVLADRRHAAAGRGRRRRRLRRGGRGGLGRRRRRAADGRLVLARARRPQAAPGRLRLALGPPELRLEAVGRAEGVLVGV